MKIVTVGDALLDVIVEPGRDAVLDGDVPSRITLVAGGQAANVAAWCSHLGADAAVLAAVGDDPAGRLIRHWLGRHRVSLLGPSSPGSSGSVVSLTGSGGTRTMFSDRGRAGPVAAGPLEHRWFVGADWVLVSGYALFTGGVSEALLSAADTASSGGATVAVDLSSSTLVESLGRLEARRRILSSGAAVVFGNEAEWEALGPLDVATRIVKRGRAGCTVITADRSVEVGASAVTEVRDTTGAGDAFAAGWMVAGLDSALRAAGECVARVGAAPP